MAPHLEFREVTDDHQLRMANDIYATVAFVPSRPGDDRTFAAYLDGDMVALGRINQYDDGGLEIGGFYCAEAYRGRGLARRMVAHTIAHVPRERRCFCIPFVHLLDFYRGFGMDAVDLHGDGDIPASILKKVDFCHNQYAAGEQVNPFTLLSFYT